ncbi:hypothetical protein SERLA73DRAFT_186198 [Serpula lacrymans var. lacrymans S7.3]|uniref:Uncharacterized protein n=2 Tax=Serpula lacrymans var. lacrymans TaxID=341189 RepID=F8Q5I9_SERL3|nr:hypothetical protein SERLA73DRAFT_186198 [Serpula lacrymans var. lacrymans S7.3]
MAAPALSIHGTFSGFPSYTNSSSRSRFSYPSIDQYALINTRYPPNMPKAVWRTIPASISNPSASRRSQRPPLRSSRRAPPPPPPRTCRTTIPFPSEDPFTDVHALSPTVDIDISHLYRVDPKTHARTHLASQSYHTYTVRLPQNIHSDALVQQKAAQDRETRLKVVAGILLHRVHAVGKPMRRLPNLEAPKTYKRSGLSSMISVDEL